MADRKRYGGVIDKVLNSKVSDMTISNIYKNIDLGKIDYIHINQSNKIDSILWKYFMCSSWWYTSNHVIW